MVNPAGYTALDLIGFTDKGTYSSSTNYVKNDLVHYSGNVWRCLVDDTTAITPVEGVNWTLFIGEPTNLVERIIAPVETDPATNAWAVGRQIIFNDNLYEVIVAITAGDALVTYEDDPTNANIKLADPVESQVLAQKTQIQTLNNEVTILKNGYRLGSEVTFTASYDGTKTFAQLAADIKSQLLAWFTDEHVALWPTFLSYTTITNLTTLGNNVITASNANTLYMKFEGFTLGSALYIFEFYIFRGSSGIPQLKVANISGGSYSNNDIAQNVADHNLELHCCELLKS